MGRLAEVRLDDGSALHARLVVAADGARSAVRKSLGVPFEGETLGRRFLMADVELLPEEDGEGGDAGDKGGDKKGGVATAAAAAAAAGTPAALETALWPNGLYLNYTAQGLLVVLPVSGNTYRFLQDGGAVRRVCWLCWCLVFF